jgi:hypothetical protein
MCRRSVLAGDRCSQDLLVADKSDGVIVHLDPLQNRTQPILLCAYISMPKLVTDHIRSLDKPKFKIEVRVHVQKAYSSGSLS